MIELFKKKEWPLLSVVIPSYNHERYIGKAIESVLNQTYSNLELIIVDDGSQDNSLNVINSFRDDRITVIAQVNQGAHNAINRGLSIASGQYLAILNSDDIYDKKRFEIMVRELSKNPTSDFACSYIQVIDDNERPLGVKKGWKNMEPWLPENPILSFSGSDDFYTNLIMSNFTSTTSNFLFTNELYKKIGGMRNLRFVHDWDFALRAASMTECIIVKEPLLQYRIHSNNTISSNRKWMIFEIAWIWAVHLERFYQTRFLNANNSQENFIKLVASINLQGNDKIYWIIKTYIDLQREKQIENPEYILLDDDEFRKTLLMYVKE